MNRVPKKWLLLNSYFVFLFYNIGAQTFQNLVPNGSFETYTQCPNNGGQIYHASPWTGPRINSTDYFNACSSIMNVPHYGGINHFYPYYLEAKDGVAYAGIHYYKATEDNREYAQVKLLDTLKENTCYYVEFYAAITQNTTHWANNLSANLSATWYNTTFLTTNNSILNITAHITNYGNPIIRDTVKWQKISGIYQASGIEKFLIIGNFATNAQMDTARTSKITGFANIANCSLDAVSLYSINPTGILPWSYRDTSITIGDSVFIGNKMGGLNFHPKWYDVNGNYLKTNAGITVSPTVTSNYIVQFTLCGVVRADTITVTVKPKEIDVGNEEISLLSERLRIFPSPASDVIHFECEELKNNQQLTICIIDNLGQVIREEELIFKSGKSSVYLKNLENGVYLLKINKHNLQIVKKIFIQH